MKRVALIVVQVAVAIPKRKIGQAAIDVAIAECQLVRISHVDLPAIVDAWRAQRQFPPVDASALNGHREEQIRVVKIVVIEIVFGARQKSIRIDRPTPQRNRDAVLVFLVAFPMQRNEAKILIVRGIQKRARNRHQRRRLVKVPIERAEHPIKFRHAQGNHQRADWWRSPPPRRRSGSAERRRSARARKSV